METKNRYYWCFAICFAAMLGIFFLVQSLEPALAKSIMTENGPIENLSVLGYGLVMILFALLLRGIKHYFLFLFLLLGMMLRELDFHNAFTSQTTTSTRFYISPEVPVFEKFAAVLVFSLLLYAFIRVTITHLPKFIEGLKKGHPAAVGFGLGFSLAAFAKLIDGLGRKLAGIGIHISDNVGQVAGHAEEILELGIPVMFALAVLAGKKALSTSSS